MEPLAWTYAAPLLSWLALWASFLLLILAPDDEEPSMQALVFFAAVALNA